MKRTFLRVVSMCLAVIMLVGTANLSVFASGDTGSNAKTLQSTVRANVARSGAVTMTEGQVVAAMYSDLTQVEKDILASPALKGETYTITYPADDSVSVDAAAKTVTVKKVEIAAGVWMPVEVRIIVDPANPVVKTPNAATLTANGTQTIDFSTDVTADKYDVEVDYELTIEIKQDHALLYNAPATLATSIANFNRIASTLSDLQLLADAMPELLPMVTDGMEFNNQTFSGLKIGGAAGTAITNMNAEIEANNGSLLLAKYMESYDESSALAFLMQGNADKIKNALASTIENLKGLVDSEHTDDGLILWRNLAYNMGGGDNDTNGNGVKDGLEDPTYNKLSTAVDFIHSAGQNGEYATAEHPEWGDDDTGILVDLKKVDVDSWDLLLGDHSPIKDGADLAALNALVLNAVDYKNTEFHDYPVATKPCATHMIKAGVARNKVNVTVQAELIEDGDTDATVQTVGTKEFMLDENISKDAIISELSSFMAEIAADLVYYGVDMAETYYEFDYSELPATLTADITPTIVIRLKDNITIKSDYAADQLVGYGYTYTLPAHDDPAQSYIYTVNGEQYYQGSQIRVIEDLTITRKPGKALTSQTLPAFIAGSAVPGANLTDKERNILKAGGLNYGTIAFSKPDTTDELVEVDFSNNTYTVTAQTYKTAVLINGVPTDEQVAWIPTKILVNGAEVADFVGSTATFESATQVQKVNVVYTLTISSEYVAASDVVDLAKLPATLAAAASEQNSKLTSAVNFVNSDNFSMANNNTMLKLLFNEISDNSTKYKPETVAAVETIKLNCLNRPLDQGGTLKLGDLLAGYVNLSVGAPRLAYYFSGKNSVELNNQITVLADAFEDLGDDDNFINWVDEQGEMMGKAGLGDKIKAYKDEIGNIKVPAVDPSINSAASQTELTALATALLASGNVSSGLSVDGTLTCETTVEGTPSDLKIITVNVTANGNTYSDTVIFQKDKLVDADILSQIETLIDTLTAQAEAAIDKDYYTASDITPALPAIGDPISDYSSFAITYAPKEYRVEIEGSSAVTFTYNSLGMYIDLPRPAAGTLYRYNVCGKTVDVGYSEGSASVSYQISKADLALFDANNTLQVTREIVDTVREDFLKFVDAMNDAFKAGNMDAELILAADPADYSLVLRVGPDIAGVQFNSMMNDLMTAMTTYSSIKLADTVFYEGVSINMQAIVDMLASSGFSFDTVCNIIDENGNIKNDAELATLTGVNNIGGKIMSTKMGLGEVMTIDFYMTLSGSNDKLLAARNALATVKNYVNVACNDGVYNIHLNMPDKLYPYYMSAMLLLDQTQFDDIQGGMNVEQTMKYYKNLVTDLTGDPNFTVETLENTAAEAGKNIDLSTYASTFDLARKMINYLLNNATAETKEIPENERNQRYAATVTCPVGGLFDKLPENFAKLADFISEAKNGGSIVFDINLTVEDRKVDYDAMIFDNSEAGLSKFYYAKASEFASRLEKLGNNSVVILISDAKLSKDVVIPNNVFINLNGKKLEGNLSTTARVTISDSTLHTNEPGVGEVVGTLSGNFIITGGKYSMDVTAMLKDGYVQDANGYVSNIFYIIEEDADGNISINIPANILSTRTVPELKALAVDIAMDVAFNVYNAASLNVDDLDIYSFATDDLISLATMSGKEIAQELINKVNVDNVKTLAQAIYYELTNFSEVATKINSDNGVIVDYELSTKGWGFQFSVSEENTIVVDLVPDKQVDRTFSIAVTGSEEDKALLAALFTEVGKSLKYDPTINHLSIAYNGGLDVDFDGELDVEIDLSHNNNYAALLVAAVASANNDANLKSILKTYLDETTKTEASTTALNTALENITLAQFVKGLQHLKAVGCDEMLASIGSTNTADLKKLEAIYDDLVYIAGVVLTRLDITGGEQKLVGHKVADTFSTYNYGPKTITFDKRGVEVSMTLTLTMTMMKEVTGETPIVPPGPGPDPIVPTPGGSTSSKPVIKHPTLNADASSDKLLGVAVATVGSDKYLQLDLHVDGITVEELLESLHISATGSRVEIEAAVTNSKTVDGKEIVVTGSVLTIIAKNSRGTTTNEYVIVIDGDVNCDGYVNTADAVYLAWHYCDIASIEGTAAMIAATGNSKDTDVHADDAMRIVFKYLHWKAGDDRYVSKFGS